LLAVLAAIALRYPLPAVLGGIVLVAGFILMLMIPAMKLRDRPDGPPAAEASSEPDEGAAMAAEHAGEKLRI
ncbi:MAG: hypothetical protein ACREEG_16310, partial [Phenylobacterium sp.]